LCLHTGSISLFYLCVKWLRYPRAQAPKKGTALISPWLEAMGI
jgi:hypothetical protein